MPYINTKASVKISKEKEQQLRSEFGKAITLLGKTESWLMLGFEDNFRLHFQGNDSQPSAFIEIKLFGKASKDAYNKMTKKVTEIINDVLGVPSDRVYVKYEEVENWGWNGNNF